MVKISKEGITIVLIGVIVLLIVGIIGVISNSLDKKAESSKGFLKVAGESFFDFGEVKINQGKVRTVFQLKNESAEEVRVERVFTSCMCTTAILIKGDKKYGSFGMLGHGYPLKAGLDILPNEELMVEVIYDPSAHGLAGLGIAERSVYLETNSLVNKKIELKIKALVVK